MRPVRLLALYLLLCLLAACVAPAATLPPETTTNTDPAPAGAAVRTGNIFGRQYTHPERIISYLGGENGEND